MKFKKIFLITVILLAIVSLSAVSAEDSAVNDNNIISADSNSDIPIASDLNENPIQDDASNDGDDSNASDEPKSSIESSDLIKYYKNDSQYEATFFDANGTPIVGQKIPIEINGKYERTTNENGSIRFAINLEAGKYLIKVTNPVTNEVATNNITVLSTINASNVVKSFKNDTQYIIKVLDAQGNPASGAKLTLNINGVFYNRTTNESGLAKLNINLNSGKYTITAENLANGEKVSNNITVLSTIEAKDVKKYYMNATQYYAYFKDSDGTPLKNSKVQFNINGVFYNRTTDANGSAKLNINLNSGKYILTAINLKTTEQKANNVEVLNKIIVKNSQSGGNISIEYNTKANYTVEVHNDDGSLAANKKVTFNINGIFYTRTTDANGTASLTINLLPGDYIITGEFENCKASNLIKVRVTPDIKVLNTTVKTGDYVKFRLTEHVSGNPVTGEHYGIVYFNETSYGNYPDDTGLVKIKVGLPAGSYMFYFGMIDDGWYSSKWVLNTVKVID